MWTVTWRGLLTHRLRLLLTTLSVVLGVGFVSGTFILTDTMRAVFDDLVRGGSQVIDVMVRSAGADEAEVGTDTSYYGTTALSASLLDEVLAVEGVARAEGGVQGYALLVRPDGEAIVPTGPPTIGASWSPSDLRQVRAGGRAPAGPEEVVVDATTADRHGLKVGDRVTIVFATTRPRAFTLVGISTAQGDNLAGATLAEFDLATAQEAMDLAGRYTGLSVWAQNGTTPEALVDRLEAALPEGVEAITAADWADETVAQIEEALGFLTTIFGSFAAIALFVGAFIIANTFSITVLQRTREFALLRALGASRKQVVAGVITEAVVVGFVASVLGVLAGAGLAAGIQMLLRSFGLDMPAGTLVLQPRTVVVAIGLGLGVTVISALLPARRAASVHPITALREVAVTAYHPSKARLRSGLAAGITAILVTGYAALVQPDRASSIVGLGAVLVVIALAATGPSLTRPILRLLGGRGTRLGTIGRIARSNSLRTPRRTWTTAAALTIGLALVSGVTVMAATMKASTSDAVDRTLHADAIITASNAFGAGSVPPVLAQELAASPEIGAVSPVRAGPGTIDGQSVLLTAIDPTRWHDVASTTFVVGSVESIEEAGAVAVDRELADVHGYRVGDLVPARFPEAEVSELRIEAVYEPDELLSGWLASTATSERLFSQQLDAVVLVSGAAGADVAAVRAAVERVAGAYPAVRVQDQGEYRETVASQIDQVLALVTALLGMALIIAVLGIMNTLALSIHERTREIGLLRAIGMTRRQVRGLIRWESVTVAVLGTVVGLVLGTAFGWALTRTLAGEGMSRFVVPSAQLGGAVLLAVLAGIVAAILPARRAARLDVLRAVTVE